MSCGIVFHLHLILYKAHKINKKNSFIMKKPLLLHYVIKNHLAPINATPYII